MTSILLYMRGWILQYYNYYKDKVNNTSKYVKLFVKATEFLKNNIVVIKLKY